MAPILFIACFAVDFIVIFMTGTTFLYLWNWLIVPTLGGIAMSWIAAVVIVFVIKFVIGKPTDLSFTDANELWSYLGKNLWSNAARCIAALILGFGLSFII